jgi:hypothetical protein
VYEFKNPQQRWESWLVRSIARDESNAKDILNCEAYIEDCKSLNTGWGLHAGLVLICVQNFRGYYIHPETRLQLLLAIRKATEESEKQRPQITEHDTTRGVKRGVDDPYSLPPVKQQCRRSVARPNIASAVVGEEQQHLDTVNCDSLGSKDIPGATWW